VLDNDALVCRVINLMGHESYRLAGEASFVIANALTSCSDETLKKFTIKYFSELAEPLANMLNRIDLTT
jgi:hypothetical protein